MKPILSSVSFILALAACGPGAPGTADDGDGGHATATASGEAAAATTEQGKTLPAGFSVFPGAQVQSESSFSSPDGTGALLNMTSDASPQAMLEFYRKQAEAAGAEITLNSTKGGHVMLAGKGKDGLGFTFNAGPAEGKTSAQLMIGQGLN